MSKFTLEKLLELSKWAEENKLEPTIVDGRRYYEFPQLRFPVTKEDEEKNREIMEEYNRKHCKHEFVDKIEGYADPSPHQICRHCKTWAR